MKVLCVLIIALVWIPFVSAKETFYSALESKGSVENEGGEVIGGGFAPGKFGNGFVSEEAGDVIRFPVEGRFVNLEAGTVECWVKMGFDLYDVGELNPDQYCFIFLAYLYPTDAVYLSFEGRPDYAPEGGAACCWIKSGGTWHLEARAARDWKKGEIHHMAGTWGPDGIKLYLDGELAATDPFEGGPTAFAETFSINNSLEEWNTPHPTNCVVDELRISDHQKEPRELVMAVQPGDKVTTTWGWIKYLY